MNDENEIETRMHCVIRLFKNENEVRIYHYTRKLSKALFYEQLYPHIFQQNENDKITLNNLTQRSEINSIYTNYNGHTNTTRRSSNRYNQYTPKYINNSNKNSIEFDPIQKLGIKTKNVNVIQEEKDENENNNNDTPIDTNNIEIIKLHDTQNSNTFVINNNNINTPKNNNNNNNININRNTFIQLIPIYWYKFRLKLINFWQWRKEITCCRQETNDKFRGHAHRMSMTIDSIFRLNSIIGADDISNSTQQFQYKKDSTWSEDIIAEFSSFEISTEYFVNLLVMFSTIFVILDIYHLSHKIQWFADIMIYAFLLEVIFKMIAFGIRGYLNDNFNKLDFILSIIAFLFEELLQNTIKIIIIFRIIRLLRLLRAFTRFRVILRTSKAVLSSFRSLFILEFCIAYCYAIIGMELFDNVINKSIVKQKCESDINNINYDPLNVSFWCNIYSTFYYNNNFNSFTRAMVVQMELIVVNNWHIITQMFVETTSIYARFYFLGVYFTAVVVVMNVLTAFVLEAFISQYENNENENRRNANDDDENDNENDNQTKKNTENNKQNNNQKGMGMGGMGMAMNDENEIETRMHCVIRLFKNENEVRIYHYTRKLSKALFYEQLYPHIFQQNENDKITLNNLTQRSEINSIYTNYNGHTNTTRRSSNRYNQYTPKYINNSNKNSIEFDPIQKLGIK
eukprot:440268_1